MIFQLGIKYKQPNCTYFPKLVHYVKLNLYNFISADRFKSRFFGQVIQVDYKSVGQGMSDSSRGMWRYNRSIDDGLVYEYYMVFHAWFYAHQPLRNIVTGSNP